MTGTSAIAHSISKTALVLGAMPIVVILALVLTGRFSAGDTEEVLSLNEAWSRGLLQGFLFINIALLPIAVGVWRLQNWARWAALLWFPVLATNNIVTDLWQWSTVHFDTLLNGGLISAIWLWVVWRQLFTREVSAAFHQAYAA
jgi:hypothetical protein